MRYIKTSEILALKKELLEKQGFKDAITGKDLDLNDSVLDHQHKLNKSQELGEDGAGLVRGVLDRQVNMAEGKITNALRRFCGITTTADRIEFLEKLIEYYKQGTTDIVHPTEVPKLPNVSKRNFNILKKQYSAKYPKKKTLEYPKSGKLTKNLEKLFAEFGINPYN